jgi:hypothetical protein
MKKRPQLRVEGLGWEVGDKTYDFEQARYFPYDSLDLVIVVEGKAVKSFEDIVELAGKEPYKNKSLLDVKILEVIAGG